MGVDVDVDVDEQVIVRVWGLVSVLSCILQALVSCIPGAAYIAFITRGIVSHLFDWAAGLSITKPPPILKSLESCDIAIGVSSR